jgi:hypothetical protein
MKRPLMTKVRIIGAPSRRLLTRQINISLYEHV